jgi:alkanesulfonate monooxygenase SsuD/methylene tetrahydromethanopterin reductase-like flavin-dependent oxidoreductase (luciferase family)
MFMMRFDMRHGTAASYAAAIDMAEWAESRGCFMIGLSEHHASPDGYLPSPLVLASAMAARTEQVSIMIAAALLPFYDPIRLAEDMSVLDHVSNGRVSYVFGLGYRPDEFALHRVPMGERARVADEHLRLLLDALAGTEFASDAGGVRVTPAPVTPGGPSISWGGQSVAAARRAARFGLGFVAQTDGDELGAAYRDECARHGREPGPCVLPRPEHPATVFVADDVDRAWSELGPYLLHDATTYASWNDNDRTVSLSFAQTVDALRAEAGAHRIFSVDDAIAHVRAVGYLPLHPLCGGLPPDLAWSYLRRVADEVVPRLA